MVHWVFFIFMINQQWKIIKNLCNIIVYPLISVQHKIIHKNLDIDKYTFRIWSNRGELHDCIFTLVLIRDTKTWFSWWSTTKCFQTSFLFKDQFDEENNHYSCRLHYNLFIIWLKLYRLHIEHITPKITSK